MKHETIEYIRYGVRHRVVATARFPGLDEGQDHFSLTFREDVRRHSRWDWLRSGGGEPGGEWHRLFPGLQDVAALHLSDANGVPMHAEANALYWAAGALDGLGQRYHGASGPDGRTPAQCAEIFARHLRVSSGEACAFLAELDRAKLRLDLPEYVQTQAPLYIRAYVDAQRPRWRSEAAECIMRHHGVRVSL